MQHAHSHQLLRFLLMGNQLSMTTFKGFWETKRMNAYIREQVYFMSFPLLLR